MRLKNAKYILVLPDTNTFCSFPQLLRCCFACGMPGQVQGDVWNEQRGYNEGFLCSARVVSGTDIFLTVVPVLLFSGLCVSELRADPLSPRVFFCQKVLGSKRSRGRFIAFGLGTHHIHLSDFTSMFVWISGREHSSIKGKKTNSDGGLK